MKACLLAMLILVSCVESKKAAKGPARIVDYNPIMVEGKNLSNLKAICNSLSLKESQLNVLVQSGREFQFNYAQKNCGDEKLPEAKKVVTTIIDNYTQFDFKSRNGEAFGFTEVDTKSKGVMAKICQSLDNGYVQNPIQTSPSTAYIFSTLKSEGSKCDSNSDVVCLYVRKGSLNNSQITIHTDEWIRFKVKDQNAGFFIERELASNIGCSGDQLFAMKATLN